MIHRKPIYSEINFSEGFNFSMIFFKYIFDYSRPWALEKEKKTRKSRQ
jgi:hypothetical protein